MVAGPRSRASAFVLLTAVLLLASSSAGGDLHAPPGSAAARLPAPLVVRPSVRAQTSPTAVGYVDRTLILFNRTEEPGNVTPSDSSSQAWAPVAYDSADNTAWMLGYDAIEVFNATGGQPLRILPTGSYFTLTYVNRTDTMWLTGGYLTTTVLVYNASTYQVVRQVPVGEGPRDAIYDWLDGDVYVVNEFGFNVTIVNAVTYAAVGSVTVGAFATSLVWDNSTGRIFVSDPSDDTVSEFAQSGTGPITVIHMTGQGLVDALLDDPINHMVYVSGADDGTSIIAAATDLVVGNLTLSGVAYNDQDPLGLDPVLDRLYVGNEEGGFLATYQPAPTTSTSSPTSRNGTGTGSTPSGLAFDPVASTMLVADSDEFESGSFGLIEISTTSGGVVARTAAQALPMGSAYVAQYGAIFVYDGQAGELYEIDDGTDQIEASTFVGYSNADEVPKSGQLVYDPANESIFVTWFSDLDSPFGVTEVNASTMEVMRTWTEGVDYPSGIAYDPAQHEVIVANYFGNNVTLISTVSGKESWIGAGQYPLGVAFDPSNDGIYVSNQQSQNVTVIDAQTRSAVANVTVASAGDEVWGDLYVPGGDVYVAQYSQDSLVAISPTTNATTGHNISLQTATGNGVGGPGWLAYDAANDSLLVAEPGSTVATGGGYADGFGSSAVAFVNLTNETYYGEIEVGYAVSSVAYDSGIGAAFAVAAYPGAVYQITLGSEVPPPTPISALLSADPARVPEGEPTYLETTAYGGEGPLTYSYSSLPEGCASANESVLPCTPEVVGTFVVGVNVTDPAGERATSVARLVVTFPSLAVSVAAVPPTIRLGQTTLVETEVSGGTGSGSYAFAYSTLPPGCSPANVTSLPCLPTASGTYFVGVNVTDAADARAAAVTELQVLPALPPLDVTLAALPSSIRLGAATMLETNASGGTGAGSYTFVYSSLPPACTSRNESEWFCDPSSAGTFVVGVNVTDADGTTASAVARLDVTNGPVLSATVTATPASIRLGNSSDLSATVVGAPTGALVYDWIVLPPGCGNQDVDLISCTPSGTGTFLIEVEVHDGGGHFANATTNLTVAPSETTPTPFSASDPWLWVALGVAAVVAAIGALLVLRRRKRGNRRT